MPYYFEVLFSMSLSFQKLSELAEGIGPRHGLFLYRGLVSIVFRIHHLYSCSLLLLLRLKIFTWVSLPL